MTCIIYAPHIVYLFFEAFETDGNFNIQDLDEFRHTFFRRDGDDHLCYEKVQFIKRQKPFKVRIATGAVDPNFLSANKLTEGTSEIQSSNSKSLSKKTKICSAEFTKIRFRWLFNF